MFAAKTVSIFQSLIHVEGLFTRNVFSPCSLLPVLKFSIVPIMAMWIMDRMRPNGQNGSNFSPLF